MRKKDLGNYHAEAEKIKADLHLGFVNDFIDWYIADFNFYTNPVYLTDLKEGFSVRINYISTNLNDIFVRIKRAESGIEEILEQEMNYGFQGKWKNTRKVIRCILSLEDQTKNLIEK